MKANVVLDALVASGIVGLDTAARVSGRFVGDYGRCLVETPLLAGPDRAAPALAVIPPGADAIYMQRLVARPSSCGGGFTKVRYDGRWGWVSSACLAACPPAGEEPRRAAAGAGPVRSA